MQSIQIVLTLFFAIIAAGQSTNSQLAMTYEEEAVRTAYARLAFASQIHEIHEMLRTVRASNKTIDRADFERRMQAGTLKFELSDFKTGLLADIANVKYSDLVTKPTAANDSLFVAPGHFAYTSDGLETSSSIAKTQWVATKNISENWDVSFAQGYAQAEWSGQHSRYAAFHVHAEFQGRSRDYQAMFLFGKDKAGHEIISPLDSVIDINGGALSRFVFEDAYPATLIEGGLGKDPAIHEWLSSGQVSGPFSKRGKSNCNLISLKCGVHSDDLKKLDKPASLFKQPASHAYIVNAAFHPALPPHALLQSASPPSDCTGYSNAVNLPTEFAADDTDHIFGQHIFRFDRSTVCKYTNGQNSNGNCNTECDVAVSPIGDESGLTISGCHRVGVDVLAGFATATGDGAKCTGGGGGAVKACVLCLCGVTVKVEKGPLGITISSDGFYTAKSQGDNNCVAQTQPIGGGNGCNPTPTSDFAANQDEPTNCDPILLDLKGNGLALTNAAEGVVFDIRATGHPFKIPWTKGTDAAFLVLDRNGNSVIDDGTELFSNVSPQPQSASPNGFKALAQYDQPENGGNGDGVIDARDAVFSSLRLWIDANHDGISQSGELHTLAEMGVSSISLDFQRIEKKDQYGNIFLFRTKIDSNQASGIGQKAYDVFFVTR